MADDNGKKPDWGMLEAIFRREWAYRTQGIPIMEPLVIWTPSLRKSLAKINNAIKEGQIRQTGDTREIDEIKAKPRKLPGIVIFIPTPKPEEAFPLVKDLVEKIPWDTEED